MSDLAPIRSYQRIFKPDRRIYQIDGRRLPVPGGVPLQWLGWAFAALIAALILSQRSLLLAIVLATLGAAVGATSHGWRGALVLGAGVLLGALLAGVILDWLAWPLRFVVLPALVATVAGHPSSDGRAAHRYLISWLAMRMRAQHRSLDRPIPADGDMGVWAPRVWIAPDHHSPVLHRGRVHGPARLVFAHAAVARHARGRVVVRPAEGHRMRRGEQLVEVIELGAGQIVEVHP